MREQFPWFLDPTEDGLQRLWENATFSFDANVLLNLYRVDRETTEDYFKIFRKLGDRIYLTNEAANQFFQNRRGVIRSEQNSFGKAKERVEDWMERRVGFADIKNQLGGDIGKIIEDEIESVFEDRERYEQEVEAVKEDLIGRIDELKDRFTPTGTTRANAEEDEILGGLMEIFEGRTGSELDENVEDLKEKARERYEAEQPPGYEDYDDEDDIGRGECEDFLIWKQLMEFAECEGEDVVFITGEEKPDWWEVDREHDIVRPRYELLREFKKETEQSFWILSAEGMLNSAYERIGVEVSDKSVEQTVQVSAHQTVPVEGKAGVQADKVEQERELWRLAESIQDKAEEIASIETYIAGGVIEGAQAVVAKEEDEIRNEILKAQKLADELESPNAENTVRKYLRILSQATATGSEEASVAYAADLSEYLNDVAETLRKEAIDRSGRAAVWVSSTTT